MRTSFLRTMLLPDSDDGATLLNSETPYRPAALSAPPGCFSKPRPASPRSGRRREGGPRGTRARPRFPSPGVAEGLKVALQVKLGSAFLIDGEVLFHPCGEFGKFLLARHGGILREAGLAVSRDVGEAMDEKQTRLRERELGASDDSPRGVGGLWFCGAGHSEVNRPEASRPRAMDQAGCSSTGRRACARNVSPREVCSERSHRRSKGRVLPGRIVSSTRPGHCRGAGRRAGGDSRAGRSSGLGGARRLGCGRP